MFIGTYSLVSIKTKKVLTTGGLPEIKSESDSLFKRGESDHYIRKDRKKSMKSKGIQKVFIRNKQSFTRHISNGRMRSLECNHGIKCESCFVNAN